MWRCLIVARLACVCPRSRPAKIDPIHLRPHRKRKYEPGPLVHRNECLGHPERKKQRQIRKQGKEGNIPKSFVSIMRRVLRNVCGAREPEVRREARKPAHVKETVRTRRRGPNRLRGGAVRASVGVTSLTRLRARQAASPVSRPPHKMAVLRLLGARVTEMTLRCLTLDLTPLNRLLPGHPVDSPVKATGLFLVPSASLPSKPSVCPRRSCRSSKPNKK